MIILALRYIQYIYCTSFRNT